MQPFTRTRILSALPSELLVFLGKQQVPAFAPVTQLFQVPLLLPHSQVGKPFVKPDSETAVP